MIDVKIDKPIKEIADTPVDEIYKQILYGNLGLAYLVSEFETSLFYNDLTYLN